jgi:NDP-sugar pyrophosphorylase family protein
MVENDVSPELGVQGIVLAGAYPGHCALDWLVPRPLLPVAQRPLITYALRWMSEGGLRAATICANSAARAIRTSLDEPPFGLHLSFLEDWTPRGAAGCVRDAGVATESGTFVIADGTAVPVVDFEELIEAHRESGAAMTVVVDADANARLRPTGIYVVERRVFDFIPEEGFQDIKEKLIPRLYAAGEHVATHMVRAAAPRVLNTETYLALNQWAVERAESLVGSAEGFRASGGAVVHDSASVDRTARLLGPVLLGPDVTVRAGATLVGPLTIGQGSVVGDGAVVSRSVVWGRCTLGDGSFVDRSMLADEAQVEPREQVFFALKMHDPRHRAGRLDPRNPVRSLFEPIASALRPVTTHIL